MSTSFITLIQERKVPWPTERKFTTEKWTQAFDETSIANNEKDQQLFEAGFIIDSVLSSIRHEINSLYKLSPTNDPKVIIKGHCAISNRDRCVLMREIINNANEKNALSISTSSNTFEIKLSAQEVADGCVDSHVIAIKSLLQGINKPTISSAPIDMIDFILRESSYSEAYYVFESYWTALVWGDYSFITRKIENEIIYEIKQESTPDEIAFHFSANRRQKLSAHITSIASSERITSFFNDQKVISIKGSGKKRRLVPIAINIADPKQQVFNSGIESDIMFLDENLPKEFLEQSQAEHSFTIKEALQVFKLLTLLSIKIDDTYPSNAGFTTKNQLFAFCRTFKANDIAKVICSCLNIDHQKSKEIVDFLTFRGRDYEDLWCQPLIPSNGSCLSVLTSSLITPSIQRVAEHWLVKMNVDLSIKGTHYEDECINRLEKVLHDCATLTNYDKPYSGFLSANGNEEEIDLIFRIGKIVVCAEIKSVVTSDSPISYFRTKKVLEKAVSQVKRKLDFVTKNTKEIFERLKWEFDDKTEYQYQGVVINSSRVYAGFNIDDIPICDEKIITKYFESEKLPLLSDLSEDKEIYLAWFDLYSSEKELETNLTKYLKSPPHINRHGRFLELSSIPIPQITEGSPKIIFTRLTNKDVTPEDYLVEDYSFPLKREKTIEEISKSFDKII